MRRRTRPIRPSRSSSPANAEPAMSSASVGSSVVTVADRGPPSIADSSPMRSPGPRTATIASRRAPPTVPTLTRPLSSTITGPASSPSWNSVTPGP